MPALEFDPVPEGLEEHLQMIVYEIMRQVTSEEKAVLLLSRYGMSKWLNSIEKHKNTPELKKMLEELVLKLVKVGGKALSVNVLFKIGTSYEIFAIHPKLQDQAWESLGQLAQAEELGD